MKLTCPSCGAGFELTAGLNDADARRFAALMGELPPAIARRLPAYLALFKPAKQGLRWSRMVNLLEELLPPIQAGRVSRDGNSFPAPLEAWVEAMEHLVHTPPPSLKLPLKSHGYLLEIVIGKGGEHAARQEREKEERLRQGRRAPGPVPVRDLAAEKAAAQADFERNLRRLGVKPVGCGEARTAPLAVGGVKPPTGDTP